ncbi:hypothetical protein RSAG8_02440, partial [Rhizoctonia solani AG-8 WAC10335]
MQDLGREHNSSENQLARIRQGRVDVGINTIFTSSDRLEFLIEDFPDRFPSPVKVVQRQLDNRGGCAGTAKELGKEPTQRLVPQNWTWRCNLDFVVVIAGERLRPSDRLHLCLDGGCGVRGGVILGCTLATRTCDLGASFGRHRRWGVD